MTATLTNTEKSKRTRTNVKQSKFGCFTCKARRVKCDEAKPTCQRCRTSKRECKGYPKGAYPDSPPETPSTSSLVPLSASSSSPIILTPNSSRPNSPITVLGFDPYHLSNPFIDIACGVLVQSPRRARNNVEQTFWSRTVPQLAHAIPSVRAAVEAFGASYNEYVLKVDSPSSGLETTKRYTQALRLVQHDLATLPHGPVPCIIACLFLAFSEAMQQKLNTGLTHLLGAFSVMLSQTDKKLLADVDTKSLSLLLQKLDLHVPTYGVCHPPELPPFPSVAENVVESYAPDEALFKILHSCFHFNARAVRYKYTSRRLIPPEMLMEQGRQLAVLRQWLLRNVLPLNWDAASYEPLVVLRAQCLAALINTSNILEPREKGYDCYGPEFQEIVTTIEALLLDRDLRADPFGDAFGALPSFIPEMGIIHPLYFTAKKYRNAFWRRKALSLILRSGKEGPWCAETEGSITEAIIRTEEGSFDRASLNLLRSEDPKTDAPSHVPEEKRINACWTIDENGEEGEPDRVTRKRFTKAIFYRCIDIDALLADDEAQKARSWPWVDSKWWEQWTGELGEMVGCHGVCLV